MERFGASRTVRAAPEVVWGVLTDARRIPTWLTVAHDVEVDGAPGAGQRLSVRGGHRGVSRTVTARVDVWEPTRRYGWAVDDPLTLRFRYHLDDGDTATALEAEVEADLDGLPRLATRLAVRSLRREFERSLTALADLVEG